MNNGMKIFSWILYGFIILFVAYLLFSYFGNGFYVTPLASEIVERFTFDQTVDCTGIALRQEIPITVPYDVDQIELSVENGDRVAVDSVIGTYYRTPVAGSVLTRYRQLSGEYAQISQALKPQSVKDPVSLNKDIVSSMKTYLHYASNGDYADALTASGELQLLFDKYDIRKNGLSYYNDKASSIKKELDALIKEHSLNDREILSPSAGYFYSGYDGYEYLNADSYTSLTVASLNDLLCALPEPKPSGYIGKTQDSPTWYFAALFNADDVDGIVRGDSVRLSFESVEEGSKDVAFTVDKVSASSNGQTVLFLRCSSLTSFEFSIRKTNAKLILHSYSGLKVPVDALRMEDGQQGVYIKIGQRVVFKPVEVVFLYEEAGSFAIVKPSSGVGYRVLLENDEVITGGKDLFDGKVINAE